ncbi:hypothetical protein ACFOQM_03015 [Paenibacillus sp. GCM10012307]|uniref:Uncharacterized protein n=1 Tax=Paenibacillus roseus TaxID=2798579 RepID=A0A934J2J9_9BACL|nr:hypothetical protein [Paenibacillus roseus]MBJ6360288.1 hypothetical protein [Paenibacillus roseus]
MNPHYAYDIELPRDVQPDRQYSVSVDNMQDDVKWLQADASINNSN